MSSITSSSTKSDHRIVFVIGLVCLSLALAIGGIWWSVTLAFRDNMEWGLPYNRLVRLQGGPKDGELWFPVTTWIGNPPTYVSRIKRLDLETGEVRSTNLKIAEEFALTRWIGDFFTCFHVPEFTRNRATHLNVSDLTVTAPIRFFVLRSVTKAN